MRIKTFLMCSAVILGATPASAFAASISASDEPATEVDAVVVTARKREENLQQVPVAVTAVNDAVIAERNLTELRDVQNVAPNLLFTESQGLKGTARIFIRGVGENIQIFSADPAVGVYIDGIPMSRPQGANVGLLDVERLEVLRGPQGTTFGKNTIGGSINFVSKQPTHEFETTVNARVGDYNLFAVQAAVNIPIGDDFAIRISGGRNDRDGFVENEFNGGTLSDLDNWTIRGMAKWNPSDRIELLFSADYFQRDEASNVPQLLSYNPASPLVSLFENASFARYGVRPFAQGLDKDPFRGFYSGGASVKPGQPSIVKTDPIIDRYEIDPAPNATRQRIGGGYLIGTFDLNENFSVKSLSSWRKTLSNVWFDSFGAAIPVTGTVLEENAEEASEELQLIGNDLFGGRMDFVAGLFFGKTTADEIGTQWFEPELMATVFNLSTSRDQSQVTESVAAFGNANFAITDKLQLTVGARWTKDNKDFHRLEFATFPTGYNIGFGPALPPARPTATGAPVEYSLEKSWDAWSGVLSLQYQWTDDVMTYGSWSRGFRSGGFAGTARSLLEVQPYDPEFVDSYELGLRSSFFDNRLTFNATGFWMSYQDRQMQAVLVDTSVTPFVSRIVIFNAGESEQKGIELEAAAHPTDNWDINFAYGYTKAEYTRLDTPLRLGSTVAADLKLELPQTPERTFNFGVTFHTPLGEIPGEFAAHVDYSWRSKIYYDVGNSENIAEDGYGVTNARISWTSEDESLTASVWARNLGDERYRTDGVNVAGTFSSAFFGDPRTVGIEITKTFR